MDYTKVAQDILDNVGGKANVKQVTHCFTRLRFILKDESKANKQVVEHLEGVISVVVSGGQFQVVCGAKVTKIYDATIALLGGQAASSSADQEETIQLQKQSLGNVILQKITEIFTPLVPAIAASGLIKGLLAVFAKVPGFDTTNSTYVIMNTASNVIFYFIPIFLAYTAAKALKCSTIVAMMLGAFHATLPADQSTKFIIGVACASCCWFFGISTILSLFSARFTDKVLRVINVVCGCVIIFYGIKLFVNFVQLLMA